MNSSLHNQSIIIHQAGFKFRDLHFNIEVHLKNRKMYIISSDLVSKFVKVSGKNRDHNGHHVETMAFLIGYFKDDNYIATNLIFPKQYGQAHKVEDQGKIL